MNRQRTRITSTVTPEGVTVVTPGTELDFDSAPVLEQALTATSRLPCTVADLSPVTLLDSCGINALLRAHLTLHAAGGWLRVTGLHDTPARIARIVGLPTVIPVYPTLSTALRP